MEGCQGNTMCTSCPRAATPFAIGAMKLPTPSPVNRGYDVATITTTCRTSGHLPCGSLGDACARPVHEHAAGQQDHGGIEHGNSESFLRKEDETCGDRSSRKNPHSGHPRTTRPQPPATNCCEWHEHAD